MKKLILAILLCCPLSAYTQEWSIEYYSGYGKYQLDDIKTLQQSMLDYYGMKVTDCFPGYIIHSASLGFITGSIHFGGHFSYLTTGGRINRADYSGSVTVDMIINGYRSGVFFRHLISTQTPFLRIYTQLGSGIMFSNLRIEERLNVYSESSQEINKLRGVGIYIEPSAGATYRFTDWFHFSLGAGYEADFSGTLKLSGQKTLIKAHWNGIRIYGGFTFVFTDIKSTNE